MKDNLTENTANHTGPFELSTHFELIFNAIPDLVFWKDRSLSIRGCNQAFRDFVGVNSTDDLLGKTIPSLLNAVDSILLEDGDMQVMGNLEQMQQSVVVEDKEGHERWFNMKKSPINCEINGCIGMLAIMSEITKIKAAEATLQLMVDKLQNANKELNHVKGQLLSAQENERKKISSELHDDLGQQLTLIKFALKNKKIDGEVETMLDESIEKIRLLSRNISPVYLDNNSIDNLISIHFDRLNAANLGLKFEVATDLKDFVLPPNYKLHLFRIIQEVSTNVLKHSKASLAKVCLSHLDGLTSLSFSDNGEPYNFKDQLKKETSFGLLTISERIKSLDGVVEYTAKEKEGGFNQLVFSIGA